MAHRLARTIALALVPLIGACDLFDVLDVELGADEGVPPVSGSTTIDVPADYQCGDSIADAGGKYTVTSSGNADSCTFTFRKDVLVLAKEEYDSNPALEAAEIIKRVDLEVTKFAISDGATGEQPDGLEDVTANAFGTPILTEVDLGRATPFTVSIEGQPVDALKAQVQAKQDIVMPVDVIVVVALSPAPPASIDLDFEAQPSLVIGF